ncbi:FkbM family methyltransferase [Flavisolibacter sp. BT320]|nr:FkbM family methyltransferase [Flavisolibacter longurius]
MRQFKYLDQYLPFFEAYKLRRKIKKGDYSNWRTPILREPFSLRKDNLFDFFTYEEVILRKSYDISFPFTPKTIIDGGGNIGLTAAFWATQYPEATIVTLEPDSGNFEMLRRNTGAYPNIQPIQAGIWPKTGHLLVKDIGHGDNGLVVEETSPDTPGAVPALSIGDILAKMGWPTVDLLKLDVEGSEKEIFSHDYEQWLPKVRVLIVEMHDRMKKGSSKAVFKTINQFDFSFEVAGENVVFTNEQWPAE